LVFDVYVCHIFLATKRVWGCDVMTILSIRKRPEGFEVMAL